MLLLIFGTRPEALKIGPIAAELRALSVPFAVLATGQHTSLLRGTPAETDLHDAHSLGMASDGNVPRWLAGAERTLTTYLEDRPDYDVVAVQGDTMSALAGARAASALDRTLCHIEAGVRSHDTANPWPEEQTRLEITQRARWHYAATPTAFANLVAEGVPHGAIRLTGNPIVSALARYADARPAKPEPHILITMHRRVWVNGEDAEATIQALFEVAEANGEVRFVWPVHPAVTERFGSKFQVLGSRLLTTTPLPYERAVHMLQTAMGVLTDSGGLQEEAATLGVPCAVLRYVTDRPESVEAGVAQRFDPTPAGVRKAVAALMSGTMSRRPTDLYGDVTSAAQIARHLASVSGVA